MANKRDLSLKPRKENQRNAHPVVPPVHFSLNEIKQHFIDSLASIKAQYEVADLLAFNNNLAGCKTIWRSQVVLAEGILDFYIHEISKYCLFRMFTGQWEKSEKYASFLVPMVKVEEALAFTESKDWFFDYLNERFSRDVFLSKQSMQDQLNLIGIGFAKVMQKAFPAGKGEDAIKNGAQIVVDLFHRRNVIAHQNDRSHASAEQNDITKEFVSDYISKIEKIVNSIHEIAEETDKNMYSNDKMLR